MVFVGCLLKAASSALLKVFHLGAQNIKKGSRGHRIQGERKSYIAHNEACRPVFIFRKA